MKNYKRFVTIVATIAILVFVSVNFIMINGMKKDDNRPYLVEVGRLCREMEENTMTTSSDEGNVFSKEYLSNLVKDKTYVKEILPCVNNEDLVESLMYDSVIREVDGKLYRFAYTTDGENNLFIFVDIIMIICCALIGIMLFYIGKKIIKPLHNMEQIPYELSKGNLALELPEEKTKFFGKFIWGTNMLKDNLEDRRKKELAMHKEKKLLLLSLTHDIKTPLSVIKLNAQALEKNLYKDEERRMKAVGDIRQKTDEIEKYVTDIVQAAREDFIDLSVTEEDFYLDNLVGKIKEYYQGKIELNKTEFVIEEYGNCLLRGDENRLGEVLQNLIENAMKYGDGHQIKLSFDREQGCQLITVSNTGTPMKDEEIIKVFDSFYRGSNVGDKDGSGLGLYICRQLMNNMNGDIFVKQTKQEFMVTLVVRIA